MKKLLWLLILLMAITACAPSVSLIQTAVTQTQRSEIILTPSPSSTFPKYSTETKIPTKITSDTPLPATSTAYSLSQTKTKEFQNTLVARLFAILASPPPTPDYKATFAIRNQDKTATAAVLTEKGDYKTIFYKELVSYPDSHKGEKFKIIGTVFNILDLYTFQMWIENTEEAIVINVRSPLSQLYEDDQITVYGTCNGMWCGENAFGIQICQPLLINAFFTKP